MRSKSSYLSSIFGASLLLATTGIASAVESHTVGVLGLYKSSNPANVTLDKASVGALGCEVHQKGVIGGSQGDIGIEQPNQFVLFTCQSSILAEPAKRKSLASLTPAGEAVAVLEGNFRKVPGAERPSEITGRQYILKISHYNNKDVDARDRELASLIQKAENKTDAFVTESFIGVNHAIGLPTPDEVVVLFYDDVETGDRFRKKYPDYIKEIGSFNERHLVDTIYYGGKVTR